ncbi:MAG: hypothetical protein AAGF47_01305 [Planctomycetota bacterium]
MTTSHTNVHQPTTPHEPTNRIGHNKASPKNADTEALRAREIRDVSVEGEPAEPGRSPHSIVLRTASLVFLLLTVTILSGVFIGAPAAIIGAILVAAAAVVFNPEIWSTKQRIDDRREAADAG